jgi:hypothetical protein
VASALRSKFSIGVNLRELAAIFISKQLLMRPAPFLLFAYLPFAFCLQAQPVTIDTEPAKVSYYRLPDEPLDASYTTYEPDLNMSYSDLSAVRMSESSVLDTYLKLDGYKKVTSGADVELTARVGGFTIWMESRDSYKTKSKDKDGNEVTKYKYQMKVNYSMPLEVEMESRKGENLLDRVIYSNSTKSWTSSSYNSLSELESYWRINRKSRLEQLHEEYFKEGMKILRAEVNNRYGYQRITDNVRFERIGKKKHELFDEYEKHLLIIVEAFKLMDADKGIEDIRTKIKPALAFYEAQSKKNTTKSKDEEKMQHINLYNLALANFWVENFDASRTYIDQLLRINSKDKDAKRLSEELESTLSSLSRTNRTTRHKVVVGSKT